MCIISIGQICKNVQYINFFPTLIIKVVEGSLYSQLWPWGHLAITDTQLLRTPSYYGQELSSRRIRITDNNSRYHGLSLLRTTNPGPDSVRYSESWLYLQGILCYALPSKWAFQHSSYTILHTLNWMCGCYFSVLQVKLVSSLVELEIVKMHRLETRSSIPMPLWNPWQDLSPCDPW